MKEKRRHITLYSHTFVIRKATQNLVIAEFMGIIKFSTGRSVCTEKMMKMFISNIAKC